MRSVPGRALWALAVALSCSPSPPAAEAVASSSSGTAAGAAAEGGAATPVNSSTCESVGEPQVARSWSSDLPLQGASSHQTKQMDQAIEMIFEQAD